MTLLKEPKQVVAGIYLRVSTLDQAREGHSYEEQEKDLRRLCENRGFKIYDVYGDPGISGKYLDKRKDFQKLLNDIRCGNINTVVVWRLDRLVRGVANTIKVLSVAKEYDCNIVTSYSDLDYKSAAGKYQINMEAAHGEYELDVISERTKLGMLGAIEKGHMSHPPFGYTKDYKGEDKKKVIIDPVDSQYVVKIFDLYLSGKSYISVAEIMNKEYPGKKKFTKATIETILKNEFYVGRYHHQSLERETGQECIYSFPAIITEQTWQDAQKQYRKNQQHMKKKYTYIFMQKIKCPCCGHDVLSGSPGKSRNGSKYLYYICTKCKGVGYIPESRIEKAFVKEMSEILDYFLIADIGTIPISSTPMLVGDSTKFESELADLEKREARVKKAYFDGYMVQEEFDNEMRFMILKKEALNKEIAKQEKKDIRITDDMDISLYATLKEIKNRKSDVYYEQADKIWNRLTQEEKQKIVADYVDQIEINLDDKRNVYVTNIKIKQRKIFNLAFMFKENLMDMTVKKDNKNILVSKPKTKKEINKFITDLEKYYKVNTVEVSIDDIKFDEMNSNEVVKIMPIINTTKYQKQKYKIITV